MWYDYRTRYGGPGRSLDLIFRPLLGWATAWSFDRLRLWAEHDIHPELVRTCTLIYSVTRLTMIFVWCWHGAIPKLLFPQVDEVAMLRASGLGPASLPWIGAGEILFGLVGVVFWRWRPYLLLTSAAMVLALAGVAWRSPGYVDAAFNPVALNVSAVALGLCGWWAAPYTAFAGRCRRRPQGRGVETAT
jgi:hypothetical protein